MGVESYLVLWVFTDECCHPNRFRVELMLIESFEIGRLDFSNCDTLESTHCFCLTRTRSATAGESERELQWRCFHKLKRGSTPASGWLDRLVRPLPCLNYFAFFLLSNAERTSIAILPKPLARFGRRANCPFFFLGISFHVGRRGISGRSYFSIFTFRTNSAPSKNDGSASPVNRLYSSNISHTIVSPSTPHSIAA